MSAILSTLSIASGAQAALPLEVRVVDPLIKVFSSDMPAHSNYRAEAAQGEFASWQVTFWSEKDLSGVKVTTKRLLNAAGNDLGTPNVRLIGLVPVDKPIPTPPKSAVGSVPGLFPDPLLTAWPAEFPKGQARSFWVDIEVPQGAAPGDYSCELKLSAKSDAKSVSAAATLSLRVFGAKVGKSRLWVTNWYSPSVMMQPSTEGLKDPEFWKGLETIAKNMAAHRQNVAVVSPIAYTEIREDGSFDFSVFDRWVQLFQRTGVIGRIEGGHFGGRINGVWSAQFEFTIRERKDGKTVSRNVAPDSADADAFYGKFLPALVAHLKAKKWLGIYSQHLADEPIESNIASYVVMRNLVRKYAPELKVLEANHTPKLAGSMDVWVPQFNYWADSYKFYQERQAKGEEVWFYTCVYPQGEYANRFLEHPLINTRLLHWVGFKYGATGYLHWGWNHWSMMLEQGGKSPFDKTTYQQQGGSFLPAGDCFIVYPGKSGQILDSIRWETMRDGIADYELLSMLGERDPKLAKELADRLVFAFDRYEDNPTTFRQVRRELLEALSR